jgi:hypothetical protein
MWTISLTSSQHVLFSFCPAHTLRGPEWQLTRNGTWCAHSCEQTALVLSECDLCSWVTANEICCLCSYHPTWPWLDSPDLVCLHPNINWPQPAVLLVPHGNTVNKSHYMGKSSSYWGIHWVNLNFPPIYTHMFMMWSFQYCTLAGFLLWRVCRLIVK